ncbi:hypothetical protein ACQ4PT_002878 [Festuca glaucescens]
MVVLMTSQRATSSDEAGTLLAFTAGLRAHGSVLSSWTVAPAYAAGRVWHAAVGSSLISLRLSNNQLHGRIPGELGNKLTILQGLSLRNNSLTGAIPVSLSNLSSLYQLDQAKNQHVGPIPSEFGNIQCLKFLDLYENNLSGVLPHYIYNLSFLKDVQVEEKILYGTIPADIGSRFPSIEILSFLDNRFSGAIPYPLFNFSALIKLGLAGNRFSGYVPPIFGSLKGLTDLYLNDNQLEADDRKGWEFITSLTNCSQLHRLVLGNNSFSVQLPSSNTNLSTTLQTLYLGDNRISGAIPFDIGNLVGLNILEMANTSLSGVLPESIGSER